MLKIIQNKYKKKSKNIRINNIMPKNLHFKCKRFKISLHLT